jgi:hypothetical protein
MGQSLRFDPSLEQFGQQVYGKIDYQLNQFEAKVFASHKKKSKETRERIYRLWHTLYPNRNFQERFLNVAYFIARYGPAFVAFLYDRIECDVRGHQLIYLSEMQT